MNAIMKKAYETTSTIALDQASSQRPSAVVIPFPAPETREEIAANSIAVGEAMAEAMRNTVEEQTEERREELPGRNALIERQHLAAAFDIVSSVIETRNSIPVIGNARVTASGNLATVTGTDMDIEIAVTVPAAIDRGFDVTIPAKKLKDLLKGAPKADYVAFENAGDAVSADFEKARYSLKSLPASDFPVMNAPKDAACFTMSGNEFAEGIDAVSGAISKEETRYYLNGIFIESYDLGDHQELRMVATDGHRLYMQKFAMPDFSGSWPVVNYMNGVIIPRKVIGLLVKLMRGKKCPDTVTIHLSDEKSRFVFSYEFGEVTLTSKHVDGTYPSYTRVVPTYSNFPAARFDTTALAEGIKAVSLITDERSRAVKLTVNSDGAALDVNNPDTGSAHADIRCEWEADAVEIGFNASYMLDALDVAGAGTASIYIQDASSTGVIIGERTGWLAVVMPMRV